MLRSNQNETLLHGSASFFLRLIARDRAAEPPPGHKKSREQRLSLQDTRVLVTGRGDSA